MQDEKKSSIPASLRMCEGYEVRLQASEDNGNRKFSMLAYTGAAVETFWGRMVIDLAGMRIGRKKKPILQGHDQNRIVGYSEQITKDDGQLRIGGSLISDVEAGAEVAKSADGGFPWQASMGFIVDKVVSVKQDENVEVNGREFSGPGSIVRKSRLVEASFVPVGADDGTSGTVLSADSGGTVPVEQPKPDEAEIECVTAARERELDTEREVLII